ADRIARAKRRKQAAPSAWVVKFVQEPVDRAASNLEAEMVGGDVFKSVGLVEDDDLVIGEQGTAGAAQGEVAEEQGVVDDQQVGPMHLPASFEIEAFRVVGTLPAEAVATIRLDEVPDARRRLKIEVALAAVLRLPRPLAEALELLDGDLLGQEHAHALLGATEAAQADVVGPPLDEDRAEVASHDVVQEGNVL